MLVNSVAQNALPKAEIHENSPLHGNQNKQNNAKNNSFGAQHALNSWFFNMAANMVELTINFSGKFWHFLFYYQKQFLFGQNVCENNKNSIFIQVLKCHF